MSKDYFNKHEMGKIVDYQAKDPFGAKKMYEDYIERYPLDYSCRSFYADLLITIGLLDEAEEILDKLANDVLSNDNYRKYEVRMQNFNDNMLYSRGRLLCYQHKYSELRRFCHNYNQRLKDIGLNSLVFFCLKKCGVIVDDETKDTGYLFKQIAGYKYERFLEHIKPHLGVYSDEVELNDSYFTYDFPIDKVLEEIKKNIPSDKKINLGLYDNIYYFKYDACGKVGSRTKNYFKVVCLDNSTDMITMYPCDEGELLPYVDLNYLNSSKNDDVIVKRKSQIDKFKQRYNKNKPND